MFGTLADFILARRKAVLAVMMVVAAACAATIPQLDFDFTPQQLFESTSNYDRLRERFAERFGREDNLMTIIIEAEESVYTPDTLTYAHHLTHRLAALEEARRTASLTTLEIPRASEAGSLTTEPLAEQRLVSAGKDPDDPDVRITEPIAEDLERLAQDEPLLKGRLVNDDDDMLVVMMWLDDDIQDATALEAIDAKVSEILEKMPPPETVKSVRIGGIPRIRAEVVNSLRTEQIIFVPLTGLAYLIILIVLFRRPAGAILPVSVVAIAAAGTVALLVATDSAINIINNVLPTLIFIIGISDSIHMLTRQAEELELGKGRSEATRAMIRHTGAACLLTSTTTAVGFISLLVADTDILKAFGWQAASGVMLAYLATLLFLPAALSFMRPVKRISTGEDAEGTITDLSPEGVKDAPFLERHLVGLAHRVLARPKMVIAIGLIISAGLVYLGAQVRVDTKILEIYEQDHPTVQTLHTLEQEFGGILPVEVSIEHEDRDHFKDPEAFAKLKEFQDFAVKRDGFLSSQSMVDFHQAARAALLGNPDQRDVLPKNRAQIEQLQLLIEGPPEQREGVRAFVTNDFSNARVLLRVEDFGARKMIEEGKALNQKLDELFPPDQGYDTYIAGDAYVASIALDSFIRDLLYSLALAMVIIFGMMTAVFRSLRVGLVSVLPNVLPLVATLAFMALNGIDLNTTTVIIFAISLGLAVDDTIHFLARFREEMDRRETAHEALLYTYFGAGRAILLTSVLLCIGLVILLMSDFVPTQQFGQLTGMTIFGAVFGDLFLLPPILLLVYRGKDRVGSETSAAPEDGEV